MPADKVKLERLLAEFEPYIDAASDPRHKAMLRNWQNHNRAEQTGDVELAMSLITDDAEWNVYGSVFSANGEVHIRGREAIRARYESMRDKMIQNSEGTDSSIEILSVSDWGVCGIMNGVLEADGQIFAGMGHRVEDVDARYRMLNKVGYLRGYRGDLTCQMNYFTAAPRFERIS